MVQAAFWYWVRKLQARLLADDARRLRSGVEGKPVALDLEGPVRSGGVSFLCRAGAGRGSAMPASGADRAQLSTPAADDRQLQQWADICPEDFADRAALVGAEIARIEGRELDAMRLYDRAIDSARANGFVQNEALANELAGRFYAARGFEKIAYAYLRDARYGYLRWGADAKVKQLERLYPRLHVAARR